MLEGENLETSRKSGKIPDVGRPRTRPPGPKTTLSFQVSDEIVAALDSEAARMTAERGLGASKVTRSELVNIILAKWAAVHSKPRQ
ncbi:MAG: hypothetical protein ABSB49_10380 [Polyangia bacterium]|jgi:hypothetical protein